VDQSSTVLKSIGNFKISNVYIFKAIDVGILHLLWFLESFKQTSCSIFEWFISSQSNSQWMVRELRYPSQWWICVGVKTNIVCHSESRAVNVTGAHDILKQLIALSAG